MLRAIKRFIYQRTGYGKSRYLNFLYRYDMKRYLYYSGMNKENPETLATQIRILIHSIEKGMSLSEVKVGFGREKIKELISLYRRYEEYADRKDEQALELARSTVHEYAVFQERKGMDISFIPAGFLAECREQSIVTGAVKLGTKTQGDFQNVAENRHSVRSYSKQKIDTELLVRAIKLAQTAPSACNRQATHVFACVNEQKIQQVMDMHGGFRGFDKPAAILAVTGDFALYQNEYERNTVFVDGGIFLMNLLYALDHYQLAACPVIWGAEPDNDHHLNELFGILPSHMIISLVAVGAFPEGEVRAAKSFKRPTETMLHFVE